MADRNDSARKEAFLQKGLDLLADEGHRSITIARLTKELEVTSGSFYWHFKSAADYQTALLVYWRGAVENVIDIARREGKGVTTTTLKALAEAVRKAGTYRYDDAMRRWAKESEEVAEAIRDADRWRGRVLAEFIGVQDPTDERVELIGATWRGTSGMSDEERRFRLLALTTDTDELRTRRKTEPQKDP
ncbi:MAG: TetR/AcrR family transcriptional regulator [Pseudomonadota bacterium]